MELTVLGTGTGKVGLMTAVGSIMTRTIRAIMMVIG